MESRAALRRGVPIFLFTTGLLLCLALAAGNTFASTSSAPSGGTPTFTGTAAPTDTTVPTATVEPTSEACRINSYTGSSIASPNWPFNQFLQGIDSLSSNDVWAVGFDNVTNAPNLRGLIEHWDGTLWSISTFVPSANLTAVVAISPVDIWAVGSNPEGILTMHWDGVAWGQVASPNVGATGDLRGVAAASSNDIWAVGYVGTTSQPLAIHWDGSQWSVVQTPDAPNFGLHAVTVIASSDVWAVGSRGGSLRECTMHWDGAQWSIVLIPPVPNWWLNASLFAVDAISSNDVWAAGVSGIDDGTSCLQFFVLHWDGTTWNMGLQPGGCGSFRGIQALSANDVWITGYGYADGGHSQGITYHWDGASWASFTNPNTSSHSANNALTAISGTDIWTAGRDQEFGGSLEHWDGTTLADAPLPTYGHQLLGITAFIDGALVVGNYLAEDGTTNAVMESSYGGSWFKTQLNVGAPSSLNGADGVTDFYNYTWAVGAFTEKGVSRTLIVNSSTVETSPNADGSNYLTAVSALADDDVWAVGYYNPTGQPNVQHALILHRDATQWSIVPANEGTAMSRLDGVKAIAADDVWAVGRDENDHTLTLHWNGTAWSRVASPNAGTSRSILRSVSGTSSNSLWAVGYYGPSGAGQRLVLHWNGTQWGIAPSPNPGDINFLLSVDAYSESNVWAVGNYFTGGIERTLAMRWDGSSWSLISSPNASAGNNTLNAVAVSSDSQIWTAGSYTSQGVMRSLTERFEGRTFSDVPVDSTFYRYIQCMVCRGIISGYADGTFRPDNDITRGQLSKVVSNSAGFADDPGPQLFEDVPPGSTFFDWVQRLANRGFIGGYPCGGEGEPCGSNNLPYFRPNANATRGQISKIVSNAAGYDGTPASQYFEDVPPSNPFYLWIGRLTDRGIMGGYQCGGPGEPCGVDYKPYFRWGSNATRGQTSKIVSNTFFPKCALPSKP